MTHAISSRWIQRTAKTVVSLSVILFTFGGYHAAMGAEPSPPELLKAIETALYRVEPSTDSTFEAINRGQHLRVTFHAGRTEFVAGNRQMWMALADEGKALRSSAQGRRIGTEYRRLEEWFVNEPGGLEQGFTVRSNAGRGKLSVKIETGGDMTPVLAGEQIQFKDGSQTLLSYSGLRSWDADGRALVSRAVVEGRAIRLEVDDDGARYPVTIDPVVQQTVLTPSDSPASGQFGTAIALSADGNTALVALGGRAEAAYVFTRTGGVWTQVQILTAAAADESFGYGMALNTDGTTAAIGAPNSAEGGALYLYTRTNSTFSLQQRVTVHKGGRLGETVSLSSDGNIALVSAGATSSERGAAYFFTRSAGVWTNPSVLTSPDGAVGDYFGLGGVLSSDGLTALVGAPRNLGVGAVYAYTFSSGAWNFQAKLIGSDLGPNFNFGNGLSLSGDGNTTLIAAPLYNNSQGAVYVFGRSGSTWTQRQILLAPDGMPQDFLNWVALSGNGNVAMLGAPSANNSAGAAYLFARSGTTYSFVKKMPTAGGSYGSPVALNNDGSIAMIGSTQANNNVGSVYVYSLSDVSLASTPSGLTFSLTGRACPTGNLATPYSGLWLVPCTVQWNTPNLNTPGTRYTFQAWADGNTQNPRTLVPTGIGANDVPPYAANFLTEYMLTTLASPTSGGQLLPSTSTTNYYAAGTNAVVTSTANAGFVFTGFSGALTGVASPQTLLMTGPSTVTANFTPTPIATQSSAITAKSGASNARQWSISVTNNGPGAAYDAKLVGLMFTQTFGTACTMAPVRLTPALPVSLGTLGVGTTSQTPVTLDFSGCPANARFTVTVDYVSNGGSSIGLVQLANQMQ